MVIFINYVTDNIFGGNKENLTRLEKKLRVRGYIVTLLVHNGKYREKLVFLI